jgi:AraC-like DNA-binding protein
MMRHFHNVTLNYVPYGSNVQFAPGEPTASYVVAVPLAISSTIRYGSEGTQLPPGCGAVVSSAELFDRKLSADCELLILRIERTALETKLSELIGDTLQHPIRFTLAMDLTNGYGRSWYSYVMYWLSEIARPDSLLNAHSLMIGGLEEAFMTGLLLAQPHNYADKLINRSASTTSHTVIVAVGLMECHPEWQHTPGSLAREVDVSTRALQKAFRRELDVSPLEYLRTVRLRRIRDELLSARPDTATVGTVARRWGFTNHSRFAAWYRQQFDEPPSETLRARHRREARHQVHVHQGS